jgi:RimJ/RimL family protein N-acetyltransferase
VEPAALSTPRLVLDQPHDGDVEAITRFCRDALFEHYMTLPWPYELEHARHFVREMVPSGWESGGEATWALRLPDRPELLGVVGVRRDAGDLGFWTGAPYRGRGYMPEAVTRVVEWVRSTAFLGDRPLSWSCLEGNVASASVARTTGFRFTGTGPSPVPRRDGSRPPAWLAVLDPGAEAAASWPPETLA